MCEFFSFCTDPEGHGGKRYYFNWEQRQSIKEPDSHSGICEHYELYEDKCNKYEFNPLTRKFVIDQINSEIDDRAQAHDWVERLDFKNIIEPLIIKPIVIPFDIDPPEITDEILDLLHEMDSVWASVMDSVWDSVRASVRASARDSVWASVMDSVRASVMDSVRASVMDSVWDSVRASVRDSVWAYISSFFDIEYDHDFSSAVKLWEMGLVASFNGTTRRLHSKNGIVYEEEE